MQNLFDRFITWANQVGYQYKLEKGVTNQALKNAIEKMRVDMSDPNFTFPQDYACWLLLGEINCVDIFGSYTFYDHNPVMKALTLDQIVLLVSKFQKSKFCNGLIPFAGRSPNKMHFIVHTPQQNFTRGQIVTTGHELYYPVAESFEVFLKHHIIQLETGNYRLRDGRISLFPKLNIPTCVTQHVKITASPLFIPERSQPGQYLWAYSITISMDKNTPPGYECQLRSRHWEITCLGKTEEVNGAGVIGYYPKMFPGAEFAYESCCPLVDDRGTMGGHFQMKRDNDIQSFLAVVPLFTFTVPQIIKESDLQLQKDTEKKPN